MPLPDPPIPAHVDLRSYPDMMLNIAELTTVWVHRYGVAKFRALVLLAAISWHQIPAGSLPNDPHQLAKLLQFSGNFREFLRIFPGKIPDGWYLCSDAGCQCKDRLPLLDV